MPRPTVPGRSFAPAAPAKDMGVAVYPVAPAQLPDIVQPSGKYQLRFARSPSELDAILKLRFDVFNLELAEGLEESYRTGRDEDALDARMHHLAIHLASSGDIVGTYRMQTREMAERYGGFYSAGEFDLSALPRGMIDEAVEIGRACVAKPHRNGRVLHLMWRGLAHYLAWNEKRYLFGCCSLNTQDRDLGYRVYQALLASGHGTDHLRADPLPGLECPPDEVRDRSRPGVHIPALFQSYLNLGAKICGPPAIDRQFGTIDFLVYLDIQRLDPRVFRTFFG